MQKQHDETNISFDMKLYLISFYKVYVSNVFSGGIVLNIVSISKCNIATKAIQCVSLLHS
jgi:hypothetical protein